MTVVTLTSTIVGDEATDGTTIGRVGIDLADIENFTFRLIEDAGSRFSLVGRDLRILDTSRIDARAAGSHQVTILARNEETAEEYTRNFTLTVRDENAPPDRATLNENLVLADAIAGTEIGKLSATDPERDAVTFRLVDDAGGRFAIGADGVTLEVLDPSKLDFASAPAHLVIVRATDSVGNIRDTPLELQLEDPLAILRRDGPAFDAAAYVQAKKSSTNLVDPVGAIRAPSGNVLVFWEKTDLDSGGALSPTALVVDVLDPAGTTLSSTPLLTGLGHTFLASRREAFSIIEANGGVLIVADTVRFDPPLDGLLGPPGEIIAMRLDRAGAVVGSPQIVLTETFAPFRGKRRDPSDPNKLVQGSEELGGGSVLDRVVETVVDRDGNVSLLLERMTFTSVSQGSDLLTEKVTFREVIEVRLDQALRPIGETTLFSWSENNLISFTGDRIGSVFPSEGSHGAVALAGGGIASLLVMTTGTTSASETDPRFFVAITGANGDLVRSFEMREVPAPSSVGDASIAALPDGGFVVATINPGIDAVYQLFDAAGGTVGGVKRFAGPATDMFGIDGVGFAFVEGGVATIFDGDGELLSSVVVNGTSFRNNGLNSLSGQSPAAVQDLASSGGAQVIIESGTGDEPVDIDNDGDLDLVGEFTIGLASFNAATLRIEGAAEVLADKIVIKDSIIYAGIGNIIDPLFQGSFTIDRRTGVATEFAATSLPNGHEPAGLDVTWKGLRLTKTGAAFDVAIGTPSLITDGAGLELTGATALTLTDAGFRLGGGEIRLGTFEASRNFLDVFDKVEGKNLVVRYDAGQNLLALDGEVKLLNTSFLGSENFSLTFKDLKVRDGKIDFQGDLVAKEIKLDDKLALKDATFSLVIQQNVVQSVSLGATIDLFGNKLPDGVAQFELVRGADRTLDLNKISLGAADIHKAIGRGFFLEKLGAEIKNLADEVEPVPTTFSGLFGISWGPKVELTLPSYLGGQTLEGQPFTGDITAGGALGTSVNGTVAATIINSAFATITGEATYDFTKDITTYKGAFNYFNGTITGNGTQTISGAGAMGISLGASLAIPNVKTFGPVAGLSLGSTNFLMNFSLDGDNTNDIVASWGSLTLPTMGPTIVGLQVGFDGTVKVLFGANSLPKTNSFDVGPGEDWLLITAQWETAAAGPVLTRVRPPGVAPGDPDDSKYIQEADYAAHGITILTDLSSATKKTIVIDDPAAGNWDLQIVDATGLGAVSFTGWSPDPPPTLTFDAPEDGPGDSIVLSGNISDNDAGGVVSLFFDTDREGFDGFSIGSARAGADGAFRVVWDVASVQRGQYFVHAVAIDGENAPVFDYMPTTVFVTHAPTGISVDGVAAATRAIDATISEGQAARSVVARLGIIDEDSGERPTFRLIDDAGGRFIVRGDRLLVSDGALLDADSDRRYTLTVRATDQDGLTIDEDIVVELADVRGDPEILRGGPLGDQLSGTSRPEFLLGSGGDDEIEGGDGEDIVVFSGRRADYAFSQSPGGGGYGGYGAPPDPPHVLVRDLRPGSPDGEDTVSNVERFRFADGEVVFERLFGNSNPSAISLTNLSAPAPGAPEGFSVGQLSATDLDAGDSIRFDLIDDAGGRFRIEGDRLVVADGARIDGHTTYEVTVRAIDGALGALDRTFTIETVAPINEAPTAATTNSVTTSEDRASAAVAIGASDADGDLLSYSVKNGTGPTKGAVNFQNGSFVYTPTANANGTDSFTIVISDGQAVAEQVVSVTITAVNDAPVVAAALTAQTVAEDSTWTYQVPAGTFTDIDSGTLTYTASLATGAAPPSWLTFNAANRTFSGTPPLNFNGSLDLRVSASDGSLSASSNFTLTVQPVNDAPTAARTNSVNTLKDTASTAVVIGASDADGDALTYSVKNDAAPTKGSVTFQNGSFIYTPVASANGTDSFTIVVSDGQATAEQVVSVTITSEDAPTVTTINNAPVASEASISAIYEAILQRPAEPGEALTFLDSSLTDAAAAEVIASSAAALGTPAAVIRVYEALFGRKPDIGGFKFWVDKLTNEPGFDLFKLAEGFVTSKEFADRYGVASLDDVGAKQALIEAIYRNVLARTPDAEGLKFWMGTDYSPAQILVLFSQSNEFVDRAAPEIHQFFLDIAIDGSIDPSKSDSDDYVGSIFDREQKPVTVPVTTSESPLPASDVVAFRPGRDLIGGNAAQPPAGGVGFDRPTGGNDAGLLVKRPIGSAEADGMTEIGEGHMVVHSAIQFATGEILFW